ncbi:C4-dicarboxylate ABC transporter permease [Gallibacterium genomosp. 3]|uniref:TRAP transporter small permease protein n=1 Tax=Gallibacterium genomosp. 3 TaxID=505345 RepID=A0A1A7NQ26_9PAST|nr:TRAP transporter small permease [Gallibacterium genomosp. 3]OBW91710.1 C4-dicarboxylate ABC transporter permease [Gallibacterium genomosp. 3]
MLAKIKKFIDLFISTFSIIVMVLLVICVTWQVFSRYVLQIPSTVTDEVARFSMIWVGLLGAAYTVGLQKHLSIDLFTHNLTHYKKAVSNIFINSCIFLFSLGVMVFGGINLVMNVYASGQISSSMQIPMAYVYVVLPISGVLMMFYSLIFLFESIVDLKEGK